MTSQWCERWLYRSTDEEPVSLPPMTIMSPRRTVAAAQSRTVRRLGRLFHIRSTGLYSSTAERTSFLSLPPITSNLPFNATAEAPVTAVGMSGTDTHRRSSTRYSSTDAVGEFDSNSSPPMTNNRLSTTHRHGSSRDGLDGWGRSSHWPVDVHGGGAFGRAPGPV